MTQRSAKQYRFTGRQEKERENCGVKGDHMGLQFKSKLIKKKRI